MRAFNALGFGLLLILAPLSNADEIDRHAATQIIQSIIGTCEEQGMLACEPSIRGMEQLFRNIHLFQQVAALDEALQDFILHRYPNAEQFSSVELSARLNLSLDVDFTPAQFVKRIHQAEQVAAGYDVVFDNQNGPLLQLRRQDEQWLAVFPAADFQQQQYLLTLHATGQLKRSILIYRMLEAEMADLPIETLELNLNSDLAPLIASIYGQQAPEATPWLIKDVDEVISFYRTFGNETEMRDQIRKEYDL